MVSTRTHIQRAGFTLIEVLAAVVILLLIVLAMGRIFASTAKAYQETSKQSERDAAARAVMDYLAREISEAMFEAAYTNTNALLTMRYEANTCTGNFGLEGADEIWFVSAANNLRVEHPREVVQTAIFVGNYLDIADAPPNAQYRFALWRDFHYPQDNKFYWNTYYDGSGGLDWSGKEHSPPTGKDYAKSRENILLENVRTLEIFAYADPAGTRVYNWDSRGASASSSGNQPLFCMDIYLETLSEADAIRAAQLAASLGQDDKRTIEFVESSVRRYYQRVFFPHKFAYFDQRYP